jgi:NAD(P)-dependent dehydrogenase (short-subunit alcohol dehydrogenase family)
LIFRAALERFGRVDALVNSAGLTDRGSVADADLRLWERLYAVNARAPFFLMQRLVNHLRGRGAPGSIVNILSVHAHGGAPELAVYASTKAALAGLTKNAAHAHRFDRIRVNGVNVGWVDTPAERHMQAVTLGKGERWLADAAASMPFRRLLTADDVARLALFLLSDASEPMTGALVDQAQLVFGALD